MMSLKAALVLLVVAVAFGSSAAKSSLFNFADTKEPIENPTEHPTYSCAGKADGDYDHPDRCDYFIACVAETHAYEMPCASSGDGKRLNFVRGSGPSSLTSRCDLPEASGCGPLPEPSTEKPPPGGCEELKCYENGDCQRYDVCRNGTLYPHTCDLNLFWNPKIDNGYGGACDAWQNLSDETKNKYVHEEDCIPSCNWWTLDATKCSGVYYYRQPFDGSHFGEDRVRELMCAVDPVSGDQLVFNENHDPTDPHGLSCVRPATIGC